MGYTTDYTTEEIRRLDKTHIWHPFTQMSGWLASDPLVIAGGDGNWLIDTDGKRYLDGVSSLWTNVHGHRHPKLDRALHDQIDTISHSTLLGLASVPSVVLAKELVAITPEPLTRVFYSDNGATSVEIALKMAYQYQKQRLDSGAERKIFLALSDGYHGDTIGASSVGGIPQFHATYGSLFFEKVTVPSPYLYRMNHGVTYEEKYSWCLSELERLVSTHASRAAGFVIEPLVQGAGGIITHPEGYLKRVRELCSEHDLLLIADEVAVGFGKTGTMFACEGESVVPDIMCLAKGLTAGYMPLAATMVTKEIFEAFLGDSSKTFFHGHTFTGNSLGCAVALANLKIFQEERTLENLAPKLLYFGELLQHLKDHPHVGEVRQKGVMVGIELMDDPQAVKDFPPGLGAKVCQRALDYGVIVRPLGNVVVLMPPLSITTEELDLLVDSVSKAIDDVIG